MKNQIKVFGGLCSNEYGKEKRLTITVSGKFPSQLPFLDKKKLHEQQATTIVDGLYLSLPLETIDAIFYELLSKLHLSAKIKADIDDKEQESLGFPTIFDKTSPKKP